MLNDTLITLSNPKSPVAEAYRTLRTNIMFAKIDKDLKTLAITSSGQGEGKTTTVCNLALTIAKTNKTVLLIDADLRKPQVHKRFGIDNNTGLSNMLVLNKPLHEVVNKTAVDGLDILPAGPVPPNPSELLGSQRMKLFLADMALQYGAVLIDTPPIGVVTDAAILSTMVDGTILVIKSGQANIEEARSAKQSLVNVKANIIGVVLNKIPVKSNRYYKRYYNYYGEGEKSPKGRRKEK